MNIKIKFIVASDAAIQILQDLVTTRLHEKFIGMVPENLLHEHIVNRYNTQALTLLLNDFSNKCLLVYADEKPAGYAIFSSISHNLPVAASKKTTRLMDLEVLEAFKDADTKQRLLERFLAQCQQDDAVWLQEIPENDVLEFYTRNGFTKKETVGDLNGLPVASVYLIRENRKDVTPD